MHPPPNYWVSSETENTFPGLQQYADAQNTAIQILYKNRKDLKHPVFTQSDNPEWNAVWKAIWKKGENCFQGIAEVLRDEDSEHFDDSQVLPDTIPAQCNIAMVPANLGDIWGLKCKNLFIRPEYKEAQKAVLWACGYKDPIPFDNIVISGSPGIGKSGFLLLLLLLRLALGLPTGLQIHAHYSLLFWDSGVLEFGQQEIRAFYTTLEGTGDPLSRIWVLVDLIQPAGAFLDCGPFFVVAAASQRLQWTKKTISYSFFMKPWTFSEVLQSRSLIMPNNPPSEHALWALYSDYAPSPRDLFFRGEIYITLFQQELDKVSPEMAYKLLQDPDLAWDASDLLVLVEPSPTSRFIPKRRIVTNHVFKLLLQKHQHDQKHVGPVPHLPLLGSGCIMF